jgi:hypothetical protein
MWEESMKNFISVSLFVCVFLAFSSAAAAQDYYGEYTSKVRFSIYGGTFSPSGDYKEPNHPAFEYESGISLGIEYDYFFADYVGVGVYLDINTFDSREKEIYGVSLKLNGSSVIYGLAGVIKGNIVKNFWFLGALKIGTSTNSLTAEGTNAYGVSHSVDTYGTSFAYSAEGGFGYLFNKIDIGFLAKYTGISQKMEGGGNTELGGVSFLVTLGYNF